MEDVDLLAVMGEEDSFDFGSSNEETEVQDSYTPEKQLDTEPEGASDKADDKVDDKVMDHVTDTNDVADAYNESPNLVYLNLLAEKGAVDQLTEEQLQEFSSLGFEEQTNKLLEIHDNSIYNRAHSMLSDYLSSRPEKLRIIEENYQNGMSEEDAIKFAIEAPKAYSPVLETERDLQFERKIVMDHYLSILEGDASKAEVLLAVDDEKGVLKDKAIKLATAKRDSWQKAMESTLKNQEAEETKRVEAFNAEKNNFSEFLKKTDEILPSLKLSKEEKSKMFASRYSPIQTENGISTSLSQKIAKNPEKANAIMAYLFDVLDILDKPENIDKLYKVGKTKQTSSLVDTWGRSTGNLTNNKVTRTAGKKLEDFEFKF